MTLASIKALAPRTFLVLVLIGTSQLSGAVVTLAAGASTEERFEEPGEGDPGKTPSETVNIGGLNVAVWLPAATASGPLPLVVFSPGFTACSTQSSFLTSALAEAGYVVAAPDHKDSACVGGAFAAPEAPFGKPEAWSETTYRQRGRDLGAVIDALKGDPHWSTRIDASRIGLMGHSLGGYIVLALAGARPTWQRDDVKAVLALAPLIGPLLRNGRLENIHVPVMYQVGGRDGGTTAPIKKPGGAYDRTQTGYYVELGRASHFAWTDGNDKFQREIAALSISFFDAQFKGKAFVRPHARDVTGFKGK